MTNHTAHQEDLLHKLAAFTPDNYRRQRWLLIDAARKAGVTWADIGEALEIKTPGAIRMYRDQRPERAED